MLGTIHIHIPEVFQNDIQPESHPVVDKTSFVSLKSHHSQWYKNHINHVSLGMPSLSISQVPETHIWVTKSLNY